MRTNDRDKVRVAIVDDDPGSVEVLEQGLKHFPYIELVSTGTSVADVQRILHDEAPEILFLDVELNDESGLDALQREGSGAMRGTRIVVYSSYRQYLLQALRIHVFDFLLKPFDQDELAMILNRYMMARNEPQTCTCDKPDRGVMRQPGQPLTMTSITNDRIVVAPSRIVYFKYDSKRKLWEAVLSDLSRMLLRNQTTAETILNYGDSFVRTHKIFIVNINYIGMISGTECKLIPPYSSYADIRVSKTYRRALLDRFYDI